MNNLPININRYKVERSKITNSRQSIIQQFLERINKEREGTKFKQMTPRGVAMKLAHVQTSDLYGFYKTCENYKGDFSRCFFGALKVDK